ncbi:MAG TPA: hypothetical protein VJT15_14685 [Pyrinomonadaceae bacterium]|nr:hypothetical protein [Pyrinomonadaceae bacterium]
MKEEATTDALLRQFLLGKVEDEERERIESLFLTDSSMRDRVLAVEQDLVEDYLEGLLSSGDREAFLLHYAQTAEQERKLRITKSIKDWAGTGSETTETHEAKADSLDQPRPSTSLWNRLFERLRARPVFLLPIAAVVVLAVVVAIVWFNYRKEQQRQFAIEQEVARLNDPATLRDVPPGPDVLTLGPGTLRGERQSELKLRSDEQAVELRLLWQGRESYSTYRVVMRRLNEDRSIVNTNLAPESGGKSIRLRLPSYGLSRGTYVINLTGIAADGSAGEIAEYSLMVTS